MSSKTRSRRSSSVDPILLQTRISIKRTRELFIDNKPYAEDFAATRKLKLSAKILAEYNHVKDMKPPVQPRKAKRKPAGTNGRPKKKRKRVETKAQDEEMPIVEDDPKYRKIVESIAHTKAKKAQEPVAGAIVEYRNKQATLAKLNAPGTLRRQPTRFIKPKWHAPWKMFRVISGHQGWVRSICFEPANEWFCTGSADRTIKLWDTATGDLKITLTGHISTVRGLAVSKESPYLFSAGEDKMVKCWDLEYNKVIRHYHGHLSAVYSLALHPTISVLVTGGRDSTARVWDIRTKQQVFCLTGHKGTVFSIGTQATDPQVITGSGDRFVKLWDLAAGKCMVSLTNHKKSIRSLVLHPEENTFVSAAADNIKKWKLPEGHFMNNLPGHKAIINTVDVNHDNVLVSGGDDGTLHFWDYKSGYNFQKQETIVQPGSLESEAGIFAAKFDITGTRLVTAEADKTVKIWKEDTSATEETHPVNWRPNRRQAKF